MDDNNSVLGKVPPYNIDAEKAVISAMILDKDAIDKAIGQLQDNDFYIEAHQQLYSIIIDMFDKGELIDLITLTENLKKKNLLQKIGGASYLTEITSVLATTANVEYHIKIIKDKAELRNLIYSSIETIEEAYKGSDEVSEILDRAENRIFNVHDNRLKTSLSPINKSVNETVDFLEKVYHNKNHVTGLSTGYIDLDKMTGGLQSSDLVIVAARPSMGKTALMLNIAETIGMKENKCVAIFSLEMANIQICQRLLCSYARIDGQNIKQGNFNESDFNKITIAASEIMSSKIFVDDSSQINVLEMKAKARRMKSRYGLDCVFIDYLQLISPPSSKRIENRQNEIASISRSLKQFAREFEVPVVALAQLNRSVESRTDKTPFLSDLRDSGAIEQDADVILFLHRPDYYEKNNPEIEGKAELIIAKQRNGPTGVINLMFRKEFTRFENYASEEYSESYE